MYLIPISDSTHILIVHKDSILSMKPGCVHVAYPHHGEKQVDLKITRGEVKLCTSGNYHDPQHPYGDTNKCRHGGARYWGFLALMRRPVVPVDWDERLYDHRTSGWDNHRGTELPQDVLGALHEHRGDELHDLCFYRLTSGLEQPLLEIEHLPNPLIAHAA